MASGSIDPSQLFLNPHQTRSVTAVAPTDADDSPPVIEDESIERHRQAKEAELRDKERALADLLLALSDPEDGQDSAKGAYKPVIPDEVAQYYLQRAGLETNDVRVTRLLALAAQKFVADIAADTYSYARTRTLAQAGTGRGRGGGAGETSAAAAAKKQQVDKSRTVLTMDDLSNALSEYGVNATRAPYYL